MPSIAQENPTVQSRNRDRDPIAPELALLLACATPPESRHIARQSFERLDWNYFLRMASWHGMLGFLSRRLSRIAQGVPDNVSQSLAESGSLITRQNLFLSSQLIEICDAFSHDGLQHIVHKGVVLGEYLYGTLAFRKTSDIDLIVRPEDWFLAVESLERLGFSEAYALNSHQRTAALRFGFEHPFCRNGVTVDLHWHPVQQYAWPISTSNIWANAVPFAFLGRTVQILSPELNMAGLCIHSAQHEWAHLRMFADIAMLITRNPKLNWDAVQAFAPDTHSKRSLMVALRLVYANLNVSLPRELLEQIESDPEVIRIADLVQQRSWQSDHDPVPDHLNLAWLLFRTRGEASRDRFRFLSGVLLLPTLADFRALKLPRPLQWLYFLLRPGRMLLGRVVRLCSASI